MRSRIIHSDNLPNDADIVLDKATHLLSARPWIIDLSS